MRTAGAVEVPSGREALWDVLDDPPRLAGAIAEVDEIELLDAEDGRFIARIRISTALGPVPFHTEWRRTERARPSALAYAVSGRGDEHLLALDVALRLEETGEGTRVAWEADARSTGTLASVAQRTLAAVVGHHVQLVLLAAARLSSAR